MGLAVYGGISFLLVGFSVLMAVMQRSNFYAACIYLSQSTACVIVLFNMGIFLAMVFGKALRLVFFGQLRAIETEHLNDRLWCTVMEACLTLTVFRKELGLGFAIAFARLLFVKVFHWLCQIRVEYMRQTPTGRTGVHVRMISLLGLLLLVDVTHALRAFEMARGKPDMMILFGFEYTILTYTALYTAGKYVINTKDMNSEAPWENKSLHVLCLNLVSDVSKLITYFSFAFAIYRHYHLPLHITRDVYVTCQSLADKCRDLYRYHRATHLMNTLYVDATAQDLSPTSDCTCIICRDDMYPVDANADPSAQGDMLDRPKKLPCGHIFHFHCLRSWLERQQTCPTCRQSAQPKDTTQEVIILPPTQPDPSHGSETLSSDQHVLVVDTQPALPHPPSQPIESHQTSKDIHPTPYPSAVSPSHTMASCPLQFSLAGTPLVLLASVDCQDDEPSPSSPSSLSDTQTPAVSDTTHDSTNHQRGLLDTVQHQTRHSINMLKQTLRARPETYPTSIPLLRSSGLRERGSLKPKPTRTYTNMPNQIFRNTAMTDTNPAHGSNENTKLKL